MPSELIVIVDDDESVRRALARLLRSAGFDIRTFGSGVEYLEALEERCDADGHETLRLTYEGITTDFPIDEIGEFLGVAISDIEQEVNRQKQNPFSLREMIINYEELNEALEGTRWSRFLTEKA